MTEELESGMDAYEVQMNLEETARIRGVEIKRLEAERDGWRRHAEAAEHRERVKDAWLAQIREALEAMYRKARRNLSGAEEYDIGHLCDDILQALSIDAGKPMLAVIEAARACDMTGHHIDACHELRKSLSALDGSKTDG